jgi:hypothetical protein
MRSALRPVATRPAAAGPVAAVLRPIGRPSALVRPPAGLQQQAESRRASIASPCCSTSAAAASWPSQPGEAPPAPWQHPLHQAEVLALLRRIRAAFVCVGVVAAWACLSTGGGPAPPFASVALAASGGGVTGAWDLSAGRRRACLLLPLPSASASPAHCRRAAGL